LKHVVVIYEGMADLPSPDLEGRTPMQAARAPVATRLAEAGWAGCSAAARTADDVRAEVTLARLLGVAPTQAAAVQCGPLEALAAGVEAPAGSWAFRLDLVTLDGDVLRSAAVPRLSLEETQALVEALQAEWTEDQVRLRVLAPGQALAVCQVDAAQLISGVMPFGLLGEELRVAWGKQRRTAFVRDFMERARPVLAAHPVNEVRVDLGENPANGCWLWGGGPVLAPAAAPHEAGLLVTRSRRATGLARWLGWSVVPLDDVWSVSDAGRAGAGRARQAGRAVPPFRLGELVEALRQHDRVVMYVGSRWSGGRYGSATDKVWAMETLDHGLLGPFVDVLEAYRPYRLVLTVDNAVASASGQAQRLPLPVVLRDSEQAGDAVAHWDEVACGRGSLGVIKRARWTDWLK
jgi:2,3-bisphosphoglycerate-independent phosphoglycerate mutase